MQQQSKDDKPRAKASAQQRAAAARASHRVQDSAPRPDQRPAPQLRKPATPEPEVDSVDQDDPVDQASYDSFPASDPPAHSTSGTPPGGRRKN